MRFAALGRTSWLYDSILALTVAGHECVLIGTGAAAPDYSVGADDFKRLASRLSCPFLPGNINDPDGLDMASRIRAQAAVSVNYPSMIGLTALGLFEFGVINAHGGDLPRYRGNACQAWAIINGEKEIVLCLHRMTAELDAGPVLARRRMPLDDSVYIGDVYRFFSIAIPELFVEVLDGLERGTVTAEEQSGGPEASLRCFPRLPGDGRIDWRLPAKDIARLIRASSEPYSGAFTYICGEKIVVWRARAGRLAYPWLGVPGQVASVDRGNGEAIILTGQDVVVLEEIETASLGRTKPATVLKSARIRLDWRENGEIT